MKGKFPIIHINKSKKNKLKLKDDYLRTISNNNLSGRKFDLDEIFGGLFLDKKFEKQELINGQELMEEALTIGNKIKRTSTSGNSKKFSKLIAITAQNNARDNFIKSISINYKSRLHQNFKKNLESYSDKAMIKLVDILNKISVTKQKYELAMKNNAELQKKL